MKVAQHPEALYGFVGFISNLLTVAQGLKPGKNKQADTRLIKALLKPVANNSALQVNIMVVGTDNTITIDSKAVELIIDNQKKAREASVAQEVITETVDADHDEMTSGISTPRHLTLRDKHGTAINVKGRWYARLEGEGGVLNPLQLAPGITLNDEQSYSFDGTWEGRSYRIRAAYPIG